MKTETGHKPVVPVRIIRYDDPWIAVGKDLFRHHRRRDPDPGAPSANPRAWKRRFFVTVAEKGCYPQDGFGENFMAAELATEWQRHQEPEEGYLEAPGGRLHYVDWGGTGAAVHLLHANGFCAGTYFPFVRLLLDHFHVHASDIRGHGGSGKPNVRRIRHWHIFAEDIQRIVSATMDPPVIGMGHSLGAVTVVIAAACYPGLFSRLVLIDPVLRPMSQLRMMAILRKAGLGDWIPIARKARRRKREFASRAEAFNRFATGQGIFKTWSEDFISAYLECGLLEKDDKTAVLRCDPEIEAQIFESTPSDIWNYIKRIQCPVLALRGEKTEAFAQSSAKRLQQMGEPFTVIDIPNAGHFLPMEQPEACAREIVDYLSSVDDDRGGDPDGGAEHLQSD